MSDKSLELINLIRQGKTCNEITSILNISNKQLFTYLTNLRNNDETKQLTVVVSIKEGMDYAMSFSFE